jgi:hypothetical protein
VTTETHAAQYVHFEDVQPIGVGYALKGFGLEYAQVVDQNVDLRKAVNRGAGSICGSEVGGQAFEVS